MKYVLIVIGLFISGCTLMCGPVQYNDEFLYQTEVRVTKGFYKGLVGRVEERELDRDVCLVPAYQVYLLDAGRLIIREDDLAIIEE